MLRYLPFIALLSVFALPGQAQDTRYGVVIGDCQQFDACRSGPTEHFSGTQGAIGSGGMGVEVD